VVLAQSAVFSVREKTTLRAGVQDVGGGVVGGRWEGSSHGLVGDAAHDVRVRAPVTVE